MRDEALTQLLSRRLANPHGLLGVHAVGADALFRVYRPDAREVRVHVGVMVVELAPIEGLVVAFDGTLKKSKPAPYELELVFEHGTAREKDPYAFLPTLGSADLHFVGEGRHRRLWDRLGAHPVTHQGVAGTAFAVWAPNA